ncbi:zinc finger and SCAN domain-containing protein 10-like [Hylaeus volcanicus]|uniref:zinc finger and SCAN domain-containing protein 10-like n=1 Tax=Hylaeus volcanicus TaxID=313075 RepID=UPI0023B80A01|nr:zinc finger and SCAN domain-containing protein 10-like [Hylaeus volcanicus]
MQRRPGGHRRRPSGSRQETEDSLLSRFFCESCGKSYKWRESLLKHKRVECGKLPQFSCEVCGYRFMHKHHLRKHMTSIHQLVPLSHDGSFSMKMTASGGTSAFRFERLNNLQGSQTSGWPCQQQYVAKPYSCSNCNKRYVRRDSLYKHLRYECGTEPKFACTVCGRRFKRKHHLTYHLTNMHKPN